MRFIPIPLLVVKRSRPVRLLCRHPGPFVEGLSQELWTSPAPVNPLLLATPSRDRRDAGITLDRGGRCVAIPLSAEGGDQSRRHRWTYPRQGRKDSVIGM